MLGRRFLILVAVLMGVMALAASLAPQRPVDRDAARDATSTPAPAGTASFETVEKELSTSDGDARIVVDEGDLLELTVSGSETDSVLVSGLGRMDSIHPDSPARFSLLVGEPGEYPIELVDEGRPVGTLVVREAG